MSLLPEVLPAKVGTYFCGLCATVLAVSMMGAFPNGTLISAWRLTLYHMLQFAFSECSCLLNLSAAGGVIGYCIMVGFYVVFLSLVYGSPSTAFGAGVTLTGDTTHLSQVSR